jgi:hypothetical protein
VAIGALWGLLALAAVVSWPRATAPADSPLATLALLGALLLPAAEYLERRPGGPPRWASRAFTALAGLGLGLLAWAAVDYLRAVRFGGPDFFYYVGFARDLAAGRPVSPDRYSYFPGVYVFWRALLRVDGSLAWLSGAYLVLLLLNAAALGALAALAGRGSASRPLLALYAALLYLVLVSRFEGFLGTTEPIATLPLLVGLLAFTEFRSRLLAAAALGVGIGLAVFTRQQAGLLALGWLGLLSTRPPGQRRELLAVPAVALLVLLLCAGLEGGGLGALRTGLAFASAYAPSGSFVSNLIDPLLSARLEILGLAALLVLLFALRAHPERSPAAGTAPANELLAFAVAAFLASLLQLTRRAYYHYLLLSVPFLALALVLAGALVLARLPEKRPRVLALTLLLAAVPFAANGARPLEAPYVPIFGWPIALGARLPSYQPWHLDSTVKAALASLADAGVRPDDTLAVFPPRWIGVHFVLGTHPPAPSDYRFPRAADAVRRDLAAARWVLVVHGPSGVAEDEDWTAAGGDAAVASLGALGFSPVRSAPGMELYGR